MASFDLSSASGSGTAKFEGFVEYELVDLNEERAKYEVRLYACLSAGWTYATLDGTISDRDEVLASGTWGGESSSVLDTDPVLVCSGYFRIYFNGASSASDTLYASVRIRNSGSFSSKPTISGNKWISATAPEPAVSASTISVSPNPVQMGKQLLISISRDNSSCTHIVSYSFGNKSGTISSSAGSSATWTVPDLADQVTNALSGKGTIYCETYCDGEYIGTTSASISLTVPDPTTPSISGGQITLGSECSITCKRNSSSFKVKLEFEFKKTTVNIGTFSANSRPWVPNYDLANQVPDLTNATGTLKCTTMNGTAIVGTKTSTVKVIVPENDVTRPTFTLDNLTLSPISDLGQDFAGVYMRGKTGLRAKMTASSKYSTIKTRTITVGSLSAQGDPADIDLLVDDGNVKVTAKVTDARGFSTTVTTSIYIMPYRNPKVIPYTGHSAVICERALETGELNPNGTVLAIKAGKSFSSVILNGKEINSCVLRYRWKPNSADAYTEWITILPSKSTETEISLLIGNVVSSLQTSYMVQIEAVDTLDGKHTLTFQIMTQAISFVLYDGPDGAGFGKYPEAPHVVDIASHMTLLVRGKLEVTGSQWESLGLASGINESVYAYGRKEDTGCHYQVSNGNHVYAAFNCGFTYSGTARAINSTPIPAEFRPPRPVYSLCPVNDRTMAMVSVSADGYIRVEWVQKLTDTVNTGTAEVIWIDGYLDYWTT